MREYLFLTDSTCDLTPEVYEANGIELPEPVYQELINLGAPHGLTL